MAVTYRNFWIIVGMTVSATVLANLSAKPKRPALSTIEASRREPTRPSIETANQKSIPSGTPEPSSGDVGKIGQTTSNALPAERQFRNIDAEFKAAFESAAQVALAMPAAAAADQAEQPPPSVPLPSLQTREIQAEPKLFDSGEEAAPNNDASPTNLETGVTTTNLNMREGPAAKYLLVDVLATGLTLVILEQENGWLHVRDASGRQGWVNGTYVSRTAN
ncbi:MAG: SH3 domain-containing protein [Sinorhizobium meliloti]|nr:SH3 domain-containing protein [Sinorhizobium meliloti]